jgi:hypothetical protein
MRESRQRLTNLSSTLAGDGLVERETAVTFLIGGAWKSHDG